MIASARMSTNARTNQSLPPSCGRAHSRLQRRKVIERTIQGALDSDYQNLLVIVIDDGSKDRTLEIARRTFAKEEPRGK